MAAMMGVVFSVLLNNYWWRQVPMSSNRLMLHHDWRWSADTVSVRTRIPESRHRVPRSEAAQGLEPGLIIELCISMGLTHPWIYREIRTHFCTKAY